MKKKGNAGAAVVKNLWAAMDENCRWIGGSIAESVRMFPRVTGNFARSVWGVIRNRDVAIGFGSALLLHFLLFLLLVPRNGVAIREYQLVEQVTLLDNAYPPQVAKVVSSGGGVNGVVDRGSELPAGLVDAPDLMRKIDRSQVALNLNRYLPTGTLTDVIKIAKRGEGGGLTTADILAQAPISLRQAAPPGYGRGEGIFPTGGAGGVGRPIDLTGPRSPASIPPQTVHLASTKVSQGTPYSPAVITAETPVRVGYSLIGPLKGRQIVVKPLPEYPEFARQRGLTDVQITMRIEVTPDGLVRQNILLGLSSGYPLWDRQAMAALGQWRFAPLDPTVVQEVQWGEITFNFRLTM